MTDLSKAERLKAAKAERDEANQAWTEADRAWFEADRAWNEADRRIRAIEAEP